MKKKAYIAILAVFLCLLKINNAMAYQGGTINTPSGETYTSSEWNSTTISTTDTFYQGQYSAGWGIVYDENGNVYKACDTRFNLYVTTGNNQFLVSDYFTNVNWDNGNYTILIGSPQGIAGSCQYLIDAYGCSTLTACENNLDSSMAWQTAQFTISNTLSPAIDFYNLSNGTTTPDFNNWYLNFTNGTPNQFYDFEVKYWQTTSSIYSDILVNAPYFSNPTLEIIPHSQKQLADLTATSTWYAQGYLYNLNGTSSIAQTDVISFTVLPINSISPNGTSTLTATCDNTSGVFQNSLCSILVWAFYPSQASLQNFGNLKDVFKNKPPFGYFTAITNALNNLQEGSSSIVMINASTTAAFSDIFTPIKTGMAWIFWLAFAFWLYYKISNLYL